MISQSTVLPDTYECDDIRCDWFGNRLIELGDPKFIVVHSTVGRDSRKYLKTGGGRSVSIHKLIQKLPRSDPSRSRSIDLLGRFKVADASTVIYTMVPDDKVANHCGYSRVTIEGVLYSRFSQYSPNTVSLGIELENFSDPGTGEYEPYSDGQLLAMGYVINNWRALYGPLPIYLHRDIDASKPGNKSGKYDPVGLDLTDIEHWCSEALVMSDPFILWGTKFALHRGWAIPQAWLKQASALGAPMSDELYPVTGVPRSIQYFERGIIIYNGWSNRTKVVLDSSI